MTDASASFEAVSAAAGPVARGSVARVGLATAITAVAPGNKDELKPGAQIIIMASDKQPDGSILAKTLYVGRSLTPAM